VNGFLELLVVVMGRVGLIIHDEDGQKEQRDMLFA
jgi:hypothetical protein